MPINFKHNDYIQGVGDALENQVAKGIMRPITREVDEGDALFLRADDVLVRRRDRNRWMNILQSDEDDLDAQAEPVRHRHGHHHRHHRRRRRRRRREWRRYCRRVWVNGYRRRRCRRRRVWVWYWHYY